MDTWQSRGGPPGYVGLLGPP